MSYFQNLEKIAAALNSTSLQDTEGVKRYFLSNSKKMTIQVVAFSDIGNSLHVQKNHDELLVIIDGEIDFQVGDEIKKTQKNDFIFIPSGIKHGPILNEGESFTALSIFAPCFEFNSDNIQWDRDGIDDK